MKKVYYAALSLGNLRTSGLKEPEIFETHEEWAARQFSVPVEKVTKEQRQFAKTIRFCEMYSR